MLSSQTFTSESVVVGKSVRMRAVFDLVQAIAGSEGTVLITGESGTGKEVVANMVHHQSRRRGRPFVPVSCAIFNEALVESELFGHERGAFTGAIKDRPGRFELARGGTVFLDDIDDVPLSLQVKLLRVLQNHTVERLGGVRSTSVDVRVVAGSKRDLKDLVAQGTFRDDLYYRLNVLPVSLPPLRERREDIPALIDHFLLRFSTRAGGPVPFIAPAIRAAFIRYAWPGNIRELENLCERIVLTQGHGLLQTDCIPAHILASGGDTAAASVPEAAPGTQMFADPARMPISLDERLHELERNLILWALRATGGNKSKAAHLLSIKRSTLSDRISRCERKMAEHTDAPASIRASA
jgi:DNA-binding NtrC family response regulator